ncbi:MAG: P1 family peptidase [bacterium]
MPSTDSITDVPGVKVGHYSDYEHGTGATVCIFEAGAAGSVDVRGLATGSRELPVLDPLHVTEKCHGLCLAGGSAFGLAAADGVMKYLAEQGIGYMARVALVPIVPAAIIFDLSFISADVRPDASFGYAACEAATAEPVESGCVGAGTGATVGKILGIENATKGGVGSASVRSPEGVTVGALSVVNNLGDVLDMETGAVLAGARDPSSGKYANTEKLLREGAPVESPAGGENTNLVAVATDAALDKAGAAKLARMASAGMARVLAPAHSVFDGDLVFAFSTGDKPLDINRLGAMAAHAVALSINRAVTEASSLGGVPACGALQQKKE